MGILDKLTWGNNTSAEELSLLGDYIETSGCVSDEYTQENGDIVAKVVLAGAVILAAFLIYDEYRREQKEKEFDKELEKTLERSKQLRAKVAQNSIDITRSISELTKRTESKLKKATSSQRELLVAFYPVRGPAAQELADIAKQLPELIKDQNNALSAFINMCKEAPSVSETARSNADKARDRLRSNKTLKAYNNLKSKYLKGSKISVALSDLNDTVEFSMQGMEVMTKNLLLSQATSGVITPIGAAKKEMDRSPNIDEVKKHSKGIDGIQDDSIKSYINDMARDLGSLTTKVVETHGACTYFYSTHIKALLKAATNGFAGISNTRT